MKYKQRGYKESERKDDNRRKDPPKPRTPEERQLRHMMERSARLVLRCYQCNTVAAVDDLSSQSTCSSCSAALHVCRNCGNFDTSARWECKEAITEPVPDKTAANQCTFFQANTVLDATGRRSGGGPGHPSTPSDARTAFDNLFKKK